MLSLNTILRTHLTSVLCCRQAQLAEAEALAKKREAEKLRPAVDAQQSAIPGIEAELQKHHQ